MAVLIVISQLMVASLKLFVSKRYVYERNKSVVGAPIV